MKFRINPLQPCRLFTGSDPVIDYVIVKTVFDENLDLKNPIFEDLSPIEKVTEYEKEKVVIIKKQNSVWRYFYGYPITLKLLFPALKYREPKSDGKVVYRRRK